MGFLSQMWVGGVADSQTRSKPPQIAPKIAFFDPNFTFRFPKSHKLGWVGGWVNRFGKDIPKKRFFFIPSLSFASLFPWCTVKNSIKSFCFFGNFLYGVNLCFVISHYRWNHQSFELWALTHWRCNWVWNYSDQAQLSCKMSKTNYTEQICPPKFYPQKKKQVKL